MKRRHAAAALFLCMLSAQAPAPDWAVRIEGQVRRPISLTVVDLRGMPAHPLHIAFETARGRHEGDFSGPLLLDVVNAAGIVDEGDERTHLRHTILVTGSDGYGAALAIGEIDPAHENKPVIVADLEDGKPLGAPRLIVPGDGHGGRSVHDVVAIEVR
jgi:hypothetical protein